LEQLKANNKQWQPGRALYIEVENPTFKFGEVVNFFNQKRRVFQVGVHPRAFVAEGVHYSPDKVSIKAGAVIEEGCVLGDGCEIGAGVVLEKGVRLGEGCVIHSNVTVREYCQLGDRVILQPGCVIGSDGYGYELVEGRHQKVDQVGIVVLENDVEIGANTTIDRARFGRTLIGEGSKVDNLVQVAHNVQVGKHCLLVSQSGFAGSSKLGDYVTVAAQSGVAGHVSVGDKAILMGRTGVAKSLEGGQVYMGYPARLAKEEQRKMASLVRLPQVLKDIKEMKKKISSLEVCEKSQ